MKTSKTIKKISLATLAVLGMSVQINNASALVDTPWGPERATFTWADPAPYATFNSITDNPQVGDERNFVRIRELGTPVSTHTANNTNPYADEVTLERGKAYEVYIYYHNNADAHDVGKTAIGIADGASVKSSFPATVKKGERATVTGTIFAADTNPLEVWDGAYMMPSEDLYLRYVPGTAIIHNGGALNGQSIGPDYLFGEGALLGYNKFSGLLPGCNEYAGYITYQIFADAPDFKVTKTIASDSTTVKPGDEVTYKVRYENTGTMNQLNVVVRDTLPKELEYVTGSTKLYNNNLTEGKTVNDDLINENGMNIGDYAGGSGWAEIVYKAKVKDSAGCGSIKNTALISTTDGNKTAEAELTVDNGNCTPTPAPEPDKTPEEKLPEEIVNTGPLEIVLAIIIVLVIAAASFYFWRTRHVLKTVENKVSGKESNDEKENEDTKNLNQKPDEHKNEDNSSQKE